MKPPRLLLKIVVLSLFILSLSAFIAYRSGVFDELLTKKTVTNDEQPRIDTTIAQQPVPQPAAVDSSEAAMKTILSSSKSMMVISEDSLLRFFTVDPIEYKPEKRARDLSYFNTVQKIHVAPDENDRKDSLVIIPRDGDLPSLRQETFTMMVSSKSGPIVRQLDITPPRKKRAMPSSKYGYILSDSDIKTSKDKKSPPDSQTRVAIPATYDPQTDSAKKN